MADAAAWLSAGGTVGAVIVALFPQTRRVVWRPRLRITTDQAVFNVRRGSLRDHIPHAYARLSVCARRHQPGADGLQVSLLRCHPPARLGGRDELPQGELRVALRWAYTHADAITLNPGAVRYVDICEIRRDEPNWARPALQRGPEEGYYLLLDPPRRYVLEVEFGPMNSNAELRYVYLEVRAQWDGSFETLDNALCMRVETVMPLCFDPRARARGEPVGTRD